MVHHQRMPETAFTGPCCFFVVPGAILRSAQNDSLGVVAAPAGFHTKRYSQGAKPDGMKGVGILR